MAEIGYPLIKKEFLKDVQYMLDKDGRKTPFRDNLPGYKWFQNFQKRNPQIGMGKLTSLGQERANVTLEKIPNWFEGLNNYFTK